MKQTVVLYPSPGIGHLISMVELGKQIINQNSSLSITILIPTSNEPSKSNQTSPYISRVSKSNPSIIFHHLPPPSSQLQSTSPETTLIETLLLNNPLIHQSLLTISLSSTISAFIFDFFCYPVLEITTKLQISSYLFFTSGANVLAVLLYYPILIKSLGTHEDYHSVEIPGLPPLLSTDIPDPLRNRSGNVESFLLMSETATKVKGNIVNTFESLETRAIKAIKDGLCVPNSPTPPIYSIGPLIAEPMTDNEDVRKVECLTWLDSQPSKSVVFLCFGSGGVFTVAQLKEIAVGLEKCGQRFLWVVRNALTQDDDKGKLATTEFDLTDLLPEGFLDRTRDRGLVVKNWAPQVDILNRESVGGFVTHCGWNSILESVCAGVPMIGWPLYAEQRLNRALLVSEMKLSLHLNESEDGFVSSLEIEERVRMLMESEEGKRLRERVAVARDEAKLALSEGGSSRSSLAELIESWGSL